MAARQDARERMGSRTEWVSLDFLRSPSRAHPRIATHAEADTPRQQRVNDWSISSWIARRFRPSKVALTAQRIAIKLPVYILVFLGFIHLLEALVGRSNLSRTRSTYADYLRVWNTPDDTDIDESRFHEDTFNGAVPIPCHSHNDYWRKAPLFDALQWGCTGVEADVWLYDSELFVGHTSFSLKKDRTFRTLYVDPLVELLERKNRPTEFPLLDASPSIRGVFDQDPSQTLVMLIDLKTSGPETFAALRTHLAPLRERDFLSHWNGSAFNVRPVTVVGTGHTPFDLVVANASYRDVFYDAPLERLWEPPHAPIAGSDVEAHAMDGLMSYGEAMAFLPQGPGGGEGAGAGAGLVRRTDPVSGLPKSVFNVSSSYYASISFTKAVGFVWRGHLSPRQMEIIRGQVRGAKRAGLKARYWGIPNWPIALRNHLWHVLAKEGVDFLNVDDLKGAAVENWKTRTYGLW